MRTQKHLQNNEKIIKYVVDNIDEEFPLLDMGINLNAADSRILVEHVLLFYWEYRLMQMGKTQRRNFEIEHGLDTD